jgi:H+-transporting ATPase
MDHETGNKEADNFVFNHIGHSQLEADKLLHEFGRNELPDNAIPKWYIFVPLLWQPMPLMIWFAAFIELAISNYPDMGILLFIQVSL